MGNLIGAKDDTLFNLGGVITYFENLRLKMQSNRPLDGLFREGLML